MAAPDNVRFVIDFFTEFIEARLNDGQLNTDQYHRLLERVESDAAVLAPKLFRSGHPRTRYRGSDYKLRYLTTWARSTSRTCTSRSASLTDWVVR